jgi:hypothetical protein
MVAVEVRLLSNMLVFWDGECKRDRLLAEPRLTKCIVLERTDLHEASAVNTFQIVFR